MGGKRQQAFPDLGSIQAHIQVCEVGRLQTANTVSECVGYTYSRPCSPQASSREPSLVLCLLLSTKGSSSGSGAMQDG